jgi:crossover junction endodeoxyribonuclease RusA
MTILYEKIGRRYKPVKSDCCWERCVKVRLTLPIPPSVNAMYRAIRGRNILSKQGREWYRDSVPEIIRQAKGVSTSSRCAVDISLYFPDRRRTDLDNRCKGCLDALTKGRVFNDDSQVDILTIRRMPVDKEHPRCEVIVTDL